MASPPLDRDDLEWEKDWNSRSATSSSFRLPRRTRRATYLCWAVVLATVYFLVHSATRWTVPDAGSFFKAPEPFIPLRFPNLYSTLQRVVGNGASRKWNRNVVFVTGNLTAASKMAGIACDMAEYRRSNVHLALMGFDTFDLNDFRRINGLPAVEEDEYDETKGCRVFLHDARPDNAELLSAERRVVATKSALRHINEFIYPQAFLVDTLNEEEWFLEIVREKSVQMKRTLIELGANSVDDLKWLTRLDSGSLNAWHTPTFEIVIHADTHTGNLERLLKSIQNAYYPSKEHHPKRITIVLDPFVPIHPFLKDFLRSYSFPEQSRISIKRPLLPKDDPQAAARNYVESFYTLSEDHSVLFLDPNTELSKWYCHYLLYTTLEYRYSFYQSTDASTLYGISLESPPTDLTGASSPALPHTNAPFLYPLPTSRAALFFPQHWTEFHSYLSHILNPPSNPGKRNLTAPAPATFALPAALTSSWHSTFTSLARARGYTMLYPSFKETLARVHSEIPSHAGRSKPEARLLEKSFLELLPQADLPQWTKIEMRDVCGKPTDSDAVIDAAVAYRNSITTCHLPTTPYRAFEVDDLFCDADGKVVL